MTKLDEGTIIQNYEGNDVLVKKVERVPGGFIVGGIFTSNEMRFAGYITEENPHSTVDSDYSYITFNEERYTLRRLGLHVPLFSPWEEAFTSVKKEAAKIIRSDIK